MPVESVTVVSPEVQVGPFLLSKGIYFLKYRLMLCLDPIHIPSVYFTAIFRPGGANQQLPDSEFEGLPSL